MNSHIINCSAIVFDDFMRNGYVGVIPKIPKNSSSQAKSRAIKTNYSMVADLKSVKKGDSLFIHCTDGDTSVYSGKIFGMFEFATCFLENSNANRTYKSKNLYYEDGWKNINRFPNPGYVWQAGIKSCGNRCFKNGFNSTEIFDLKYDSKIWSVPERWKYTDAARTTRPFLPSESLEILKLLRRENVGFSARRVAPKKLTSFVPIHLHLQPNTNGYVKDEKILEAWILENLSNNGNNLRYYNNVTRTFGNLSYFGNNMPAGYLLFMDIFSYIENNSEISRYRIIELKSSILDENSWSAKKNELMQLLSYLDWTVAKLAKSDSKMVDGILVAHDFHDTYVDYVKKHNRIEKGRRISLVKYRLQNKAIIFQKII